MPHFTDIDTVSIENLRAILQNAREMKAARASFLKGACDNQLALKGHSAVLILEKPSTRTRVSFDLGLRQLGGQTVILNNQETHLGKGETIADTARVLSCYVDLIILRTSKHEYLSEMVENASVPVINGLTDLTHPCQIMADIMTYEEHRGTIEGKTVLWAGDGNNVCHSFLHAAASLKFTIIISGPDARRPNADIVKKARAQGGKVVFQSDINAAIVEADLIVTDAWASMHDNITDKAAYDKMMRPYQINDTLMKHSKEEALFMHCLPAHREEEVTSAVMDGPKSVVFDEAENRLHVQKAIMRWCLNK